MNFNSEGRWGEKRQVLAQQGERVLWEETVETQTALYEATSSRCLRCCSGWKFLYTRPGIAAGSIWQREMCTPRLIHTATRQLCWQLLPSVPSWSAVLPVASLHLLKESLKWNTSQAGSCCSWRRGHPGPTALKDKHLHTWCTAENRDLKIDYPSSLSSKQNLFIY